MQKEKRRRRAAREQEHLGTLSSNCGCGWLAMNPTPDGIVELYKAEDATRDRERQDALRLYRRSRVRWLKLGKAPTNYFFNQLKAKHARESIKRLRLDSGEVTPDEDQIVNEIFVFICKRRIH